LPDWVEAVQIKPSNLYAGFKSKEGSFLTAPAPERWRAVLQQILTLLDER